LYAFRVIPKVVAKSLLAVLAMFAASTALFPSKVYPLVALAPFPVPAGIVTP